MSLVINKTQLLEVINEELQKVMIDEGWAGRAYGETGPEAHEDEEDREPAELEWPGGSEEEGGLRTDTRLGGDWEGDAIDDEPAPRRPPKEYRREAIKILATFNIDIPPQAIDILAWELYNKAASATTQTMGSDEDKPSLLKRMLQRAIKEDLKMRMSAIVLHEVNQEQLSAIRYFTKGQPYEVESMMVQLVDRYGFNIDEVESLASQLRQMQSGELGQGPDTPELGQMVKEEIEAYLEEVYSDKQRRWACAQANKSAGKRKKSLSKKEADEMCKGPKLKSKRKNK